MSIEGLDMRDVAERMQKLQEVKDRVQREHGLSDEEMQKVIEALSLNLPIQDQDEKLKKFEELSKNPKIFDAYGDFVVYMVDALK